MSRQFIVVGGVSGVGKSSLCGVLKGVFRRDKGAPCIIVDSNQIRVEQNVDRLKSDKKAAQLIDSYLLKNKDVIWETILFGKIAPKVILAAREKGYHVRLYYIALNSAEESFARIKNRVLRGGYDTPEEDVNKQYICRFSDLLRVMPYCDEVVLLDNENGFVEVAEYHDDELFMTKEAQPQWLLDLKEIVSEYDQDL